MLAQPFELKMRSALPLVFFACVAGASAQPVRFALAIVRADGAIVPFAAYDDGRWERAWPEAGEAADRPETIDAIDSVWRKRGEPVPRTWTVWPATGGPSIQTRVNGTDVVAAHCQNQVALTSGLRPIKAGHRVKLGVAADSNLRIGAAEEVHASDPVWRRASELMLADMSKLEAAQAWADRWELPSETPQPVARIKALYREARSPRSPLYFVAEKPYRTPSTPQDASCARVTIMTGWLVPAEAGDLVLRDAKVFLSDCDRKQVRTALPLAAVRVASQVFWVLQEHGYEDETYLVAEVGPTSVRFPLEVNGGGC